MASLLVILILALAPPGAVAAPAGGGRVVAAGTADGSLETAASRASDTARSIAISLIGLALAAAGVVLCFKRDFKEAVGVLAIGVIAVLLATPTGVGVLQDTVNLLFG
jgi:hypothetical protein